MYRIAAYLLQVTAAAVICGTLKTISGEKGANAQLIRILCGIFMAITILSPLKGFDLEWWKADFTDYRGQAQSVIEDVKTSVGNELAESIRFHAETYILEKAKSLGVTPQVEVFVSLDTVPVPTGVRIIGPVPPYARGRLSSWICEELGIPMEEQEWVNSSQESS